MNRLMRRLLALLLLCTSLTVQAAKAPLVEPAADQAPRPAEGKALVVFMRPSFYGGLIASTVYDTTDTDTTFIGSVGYKQKMAYQADPGFHRFMVIAENADFVDATLEAGKTYYVLVRARPGAWKARFSLIPLPADPAAEFSIAKPDFAEWQAATSYVQTTAAGTAWYEAHRAEIEAKKADYLEKWNRMLPADKAELTIRAEDGVAATP